MIRNVVFDLGRVLVDFDPEAYARDLGYEGEEARRLLDEIFYSEDWMLHDRGDYDRTATLRAALEAKYPAHAAAIRALLQPDWVKMHVLRREVADYLHALKEHGFRIFILSNLSADSHDYVSGFDFFKDVDGAVFSYMERVVKPDERIYRILLDRYGLDPGETVFLDDSAANIEAAKRCGLHGIVFTDLAAARPALEQIISAAG